MTSLLEQINNESGAIAQLVSRSLVQVHTAAGAGSGTVWHPQGLIVTNAHVVQHQPLRVVLGDGRRFPARLLASDPALDLAALMIEADGLPTISLGDSRALRPGQWVLALGHPWGVWGAGTAGNIIGMGSGWVHGLDPDRELVLVSLHLRPGHSGGPLVDAQGRLVGVNAMISGPDVGMAVPVHVAKAFLHRAFQKHRLAAVA